jgi:hypothetical protein
MPNIIKFTAFNLTLLDEKQIQFMVSSLQTCKGIF